MARRKDGIETQKQILEAAGVIFGEKGFRDATIEDICKHAGTNTASVNYHFGDKKTLYKEAWHQAFQQSIEKYPPDGGVGSNVPAKERLRLQILSLMRRILDPGNCEFDIVHREIANPTGLLAEVMRIAIEPIQRKFSALIRELLGDRATDQDVWLCMMSVRTQCFNPMIRMQRGPSRFKPPFDPGPPHADLNIEELAEHIARFSLAGIREIRRQRESNHETSA